MKMKKRNCRTLFRHLLSCILLILTMAPNGLYGRDYRISAVGVNIWPEQDGSMPADLLRFWVHGAMDAFAGMTGPAIIDDETRRTAEVAAQHIRNMERQEALERRYAKAPRVLLLVALAYALFWMWLYRFYGGIPRVQRRPGPEKSLPSRKSPAMINYLMTGGQVTANAMAATIFHLATRKFIQIEEKKVESVDPQKKSSLQDVVFHFDREHWETHKENLTSYENELLAFLFDKLLGTTDTLNLNDLKGHVPAMHQFFLQWIKIVKARGATMGWFDLKSKKGRNIGLTSTLVLLAILIPLLFYYGPVLAFGFILIFIGLILSSHMYRHTGKGELEYRQWRALKDYLKQIHFEKQSGDSLPDTFSDYLVYGTAMGLERPFYYKLTRWLEGCGPDTCPEWIVIYTSARAPNVEALRHIVTTTGGAFTTAIGGAGSMGAGGVVSSGSAGAR